MPGFPVHHQHPEFTQTHDHRVGDAIQPSLPLSSPSPPAPNPSQHQGLSNESTLHMRWPKYWSFSFSIGPSKGHPGLISFRMDWLDLLAVQSRWSQRLGHSLVTNTFTSLGGRSKNTCYESCHGVYSLCFLPGVLRFLVLHLSLPPFLS